LSGVDIPDFQKLVDNAYDDFAAQLEADGFEIITPEEAGKTKYYSGCTKVDGVGSSTDQVPKRIMITPTRYDHWVKGISNSGREKVKFVDTSSKLRKDLGDSYVAKATFIFLFVNLEASSTSLAHYASSKVMSDINLRMATAVETMDKEQMGIKSIAKGFTTSPNASRLASKVHFIAGHTASSPLFDSSKGLKRDVYFGGIFANTKLREITSTEVATFRKSEYPQLVMISG